MRGGGRILKEEDNILRRKRLVLTTNKKKGKKWSKNKHWKRYSIYFKEDYDGGSDDVWLADRILRESENERWLVRRFQIEVRVSHFYINDAACSDPNNLNLESWLLLIVALDQKREVNEDWKELGTGLFTWVLTSPNRLFLITVWLQNLWQAVLIELNWMNFNKLLILSIPNG